MTIPAATDYSRSDGPMALDLPLEVFGQNDTLSIMTPFVYVFPSLNPDIRKCAAVLEAGLDKLTATFPWIAGKIVNTGRTDDCSGVFKIVNHWSTPGLAVKDWRNDKTVPTMVKFLEAEIPCSMLKEEFFAPIMVLPTEIEEDRSPLFHVQVSFVTGGAILTIMANHQALDGTAQDQMVYLLDKACNNVPYTDEEIRIGNLRRETVVTPFEDDWQGSEHSRYLKPPPTVNHNEDSPVESVEHRWVEIVFSPSSLSLLKSTISKDLPSGFVSTDDALTALIWQSLAKVRSKRLSGSTTTTLGRAVNPRRYLNIPATYPGYISNNAYSTYALEDLAQSSLASIALELRTKVDPMTSGLAQTTREFATMLYRARNKNTLAMNGALDLDRDLMLSSWANFRGYEFDFGLGFGKPTHFRRTDQNVVPSLAFFLPRRSDGEIVLSICLRIDDLMELKLDPNFTLYGRFISK